MTTKSLEAHYLAGGNVPNVVRALIAANRADIPLSYKRAAAIDLAGRNVLEAVQTSVNPKVIPCPDPSQGRPDDRRGGQERHPAQGEGQGHRPDEHRPARRRRHRRDDHRARRRGDRQRDRLGRHAQPGAREARLDLQAGAGEGARRRHGLRDPLDRHRRHRRRRQHRRQPPGPAGRGRHPRRPRQGRGATRVRRRHGAGDDRRMSRPTAPRSSRPRPRSRWPSPRRSARGTSASPTTTTCATSSPTPRCGRPSPARAIPAASRRRADPI